MLSRTSVALRKLETKAGRSPISVMGPRNNYRSNSGRQYHQYVRATYRGFNKLFGLLSGTFAAAVVVAASDDKKEDSPQQTVITGTHPHGAFVVVYLSEDADLTEVAKAAANLPGLVELLSPVPEKGAELPPLMAGVAFGPDVWRKLCALNNKLSIPTALTDYKTRRGKHGAMPATGGDLFLHVKAESNSLCFETVKAFIESLPKGSVAKFDDRYGWQFQDGRDLSGFQDGTENPAQPDDRADAGLIKKSEDPHHVNGSFVMHQRWIHVLPLFHSLTVDEQENIIGRTKPESGELDPLPEPSHVARTRDDKGNKIPIVRQSMPFGTVNGEHGLLFIAYANTPKKFDVMLDRMTGNGHPHGVNDAVMTFSKAVTGQYFYVPSAAELRVLSQ